MPDPTPPEPRPERRFPRLLGGLPLVFFLVHLRIYLHRGHAEEVMWSCTVANLIVAAGCFLRSRWLLAVALCWLGIGNVMWLLDLFTGGELFINSIFTHFGATLIAGYGVYRLGWPRWSFVAATGAMLLLQQISRLVTPPGANVNFAFSVYKGWEPYFPSYPRYWLMLFTQAVLSFYVTERLALWLLGRAQRR